MVDRNFEMLVNVVDVDRIMRSNYHISAHTVHIHFDLCHEVSLHFSPLSALKRIKVLLAAQSSLLSCVQ